MAFHVVLHFQKMKTVFMFRRWPFLITLKEFLKNANLLQSYSFFLNKGLVSQYNTHERAQRVILANARNECHFKIQIGYFGYCRIPLDTEKIIILRLFFCKREGLTRLVRNLPIWVKIARFNSFFLMKVTISKS